MAPASPAFATDLLSLVKQGLISQDRVDASCRRVLEFKNALGLLNKDGPPEAPKDIEVRREEMGDETKCKDRGRETRSVVVTYFPHPSCCQLILPTGSLAFDC